MKKLLLFIFAAVCTTAHATITQPILQPHITLVDASGNPCAGCSLYTYIAGTSTALATYTNSAGISSNTNPIVLDAAGGATIWIGQTAYKFVLKDASGGTIWTVDQVVSMTTLGCLGNNAIDHGCTGATTSQGAATNIVDGNNIKPASVQNANVNGVYVVTKYGAIGDCTATGATTACTDNHAAIQAAIDAAYATGGSVYIPTNTGATGSTIYYTATAINPKGVSIDGPDSAFYPFNAKVAVRGAPGKDVFAVGDPTSAGYVQPLSSFHVRNLNIIVDDSVDASASFLYRLPGRTVQDAAISSSSAVLTSATGIFQPGDVGQAIEVDGAGGGGANLITSVASWQSVTQVTLTATASTAVSGKHAYISVMGFSTTQTIGNCAWAYDEKTNTGTYIQYGILHGDFTNVSVGTVDNQNNINLSCGFLFQGNAAPYHVRWTHGTVIAQFSFAFIPSNIGAPSSGAATGIGDYNVFENDWIIGNYPFLSYNGNGNTLTNVQLSGVRQGLHILNAYGIADNMANSWHLDIAEEEPDASCGSSPISYRIAGLAHTVNRLESFTCAAGSMWWDANGSIVDSWLPNETTFNLSGNGNTFTVPFYKNSAIGTFNITGVSNTFKTRSNSSPIGGIWPAREQYAGNYATSFGPAQLSRGSVAFDRKADFIGKGATAYYFNNEDLWLWPNELNGIGCTGLSIAADTTSESGRSIQIPSTAGGCTYQGSNGTLWTIGKQFPAGKVRVYIKAKGSASITGWTWQVAVDSGGFTGLCTGTNNLTTSYQVFSCDADLSSYSGKQFYLSIDAPANDIASVAWFGVQPYATPSLSTGVKIYGTCLAGSYVLADGSGCSQYIDQDVTTGALPDNTPATVSLTTALPTALDSCACSDNSAHVQGGNIRPIGCNVAGASAPYTSIFVTATGSGASATCRVRGH